MNEIEQTKLIKFKGDANLIFAHACSLNHDIEKSIYWFGHAASQGNKESHRILCDYFYSDKYDYDYFAHTVDWFKKNAKLGDAESQCILGEFYTLGIGLPKNHEQAVKLFKKSAKQGFPRGQDWLGSMYAHGWGITKNDLDALKWYTLAAEKGYSSAEKGIYIIGCDYIAEAESIYSQCKKKNQKLNRTRFVELLNFSIKCFSVIKNQNLDAAFEIYRAQKMDDDHFHNYGEYRKETLNSLIFVGKKGHLEAQKLLADYFLEKVEEHERIMECIEDENGVEQAHEEINTYLIQRDKKEGLKWCKMAALQGDSEAQRILGDEYRDSKKLEKSHDWLDLANRTEPLNEKSYHSLIKTKLEMYKINAYEQRVAGSLNEAIKLYEKASLLIHTKKESRFFNPKVSVEQGDLHILRELGSAHFDSCNLQESILWFRLCADRGDADDNFLLSELLFRISAKFEAEEILFLQACRGHARSIKKIIDLHSDWLFKKASDLKSSISFFEKNSKHGDESSQYQLGELYLYTGSDNGDYDKSKKYYESAASKGHKKAVEKLKRFYSLKRRLIYWKSLPEFLRRPTIYNNSHIQKIKENDLKIKKIRDEEKLRSDGIYFNWRFKEFSF